MWEIEGRYRGDGYGEREEIERKMREATSVATRMPNAKCATATGSVTREATCPTATVSVAENTAATDMANEEVSGEPDPTPDSAGKTNPERGEIPSL